MTVFDISVNGMPEDEEELRRLSELTELSKNEIIAEPEPTSNRPVELASGFKFKLTPISYKEIQQYNLDMLKVERSLSTIRDVSEVPIGSVVQRLRESHHEVARLVAQGKKNTEIEILTGYHHITVAQFRKDPTFNALVVRYQKGRDIDTMNIQSRLKIAAADTTGELVHRAMQPGVKLDDLRKVAFGLLDRTGHGPSNDGSPGVGNVNVHIGLSSTEKAEIRAVHAEKITGPVIDAEYTTVEPET